jgi:hypothetical protein
MRAFQLLAVTLGAYTGCGSAPASNLPLNQFKSAYRGQRGELERES